MQRTTIVPDDECTAHIEVGARHVGDDEQIDVIRCPSLARQVVVTEHENSSSAVVSSFAAVRALIASLAAADDERAALGAVVDHLRPTRPDTAELVLVDVDRGADGPPRTGRVVATWRDGHVLPDSETRPPVDLPDALWAAPTSTPTYTARGVLLPLHAQGGRLGALRLGWSADHAFTDDERDVLSLVMTALAGHLEALRTRQALRAALAEREALDDVTRRLNRTTTLEQRLRVLVQPAPAADEAEVVLCSLESDETGAPVWLSVISVLPAVGKQTSTELGTRFHLPSIPFAGLYLSSPDVPLLISDIRRDPRVDEISRGLYAQTGVQATIVMALTLHGRWVGLLNITWLRPIDLGARELRIYRAIAAQAALLLDNNLMVERLQSTLQAAQQQGELLQTVLDHIPVGVLLLEALTSRPILTNAATDRLLGPQRGPVGDAPPYTVLFPGTDRPVPADRLVGARVFTTGATETEEVDVVAPGRERVQLEVTGVPMRGRERAVRNALLVLVDVTARKRAEAERLHLQDEVIRVQAAALAERSSPIIPITDDILVLPLIGSIDVERGQQVLATILEGTAQRRAKVAIIDITGVGHVDTQAATALTGAARALRLLGVEPILSGIRPDVAQTLVDLGVRLDGITTCGTLQSSIQHALRRLGRAGLTG